MDIVYCDNTLFVDLMGEVDFQIVKNRIFDISSKFNISNVIIGVDEMFNYKRKDFDNLSKDYSKIYKGKIKIKRS